MPSPPTPAAVPRPEPEPLSGAETAGFLALGCLVPVLGPLVSLLFGVVNRKRSGAAALIGTGVMLLPAHLFLVVAAGLGLFKTGQFWGEAQIASCKDNGVEVQHALQAYAQSHAGQYPADISALMQQGYVTALPLNPYTAQPVRFIQPGTQPFEGELAYLPRSENGKVTGYRLLCFGSSKSETSVDALAGEEHVVLVLTEAARHSAWT